MAPRRPKGRELEAGGEATELSLELSEIRELSGGRIECTFGAAGEGGVNVVAGTEAAYGRTGEPVSGVGDEATSGGRDIARGRLTEATRIVLDQATA